MKPSLTFLALSFAVIAAGIALDKGIWTCVDKGVL